MPDGPQARLDQDPLLTSVPEAEGYKVLGGVVLYQKLGQGGMGAVYRGRHFRLGIDVAVKVMAPPMNISPEMQEQFVKRFLREAKVALLVTHPRLIRVLTVDAVGGVYYLVMDFIEGETAGERAKRKGPLSENEALQVCLGAAEGLAAAHQKGIVHRDVKPDNILVGRDGSIRVIDLGLAKAYGDTEDLTMMSEMTQSHQAMGTPQYMSLEQFESAKDVGPAADVWSLGVTLYNLLARKLPWDFMNVPGLIAAMQRDAPTNIKEYRPDLSDGVCTILNRSIEKDLARRYRDCVEMRDAIHAHLAGTPEENTVVLSDPMAGSTKHALIEMEPPDDMRLTLISRSMVADPAADTAKMPAARPSEQLTVDMGPGVASARARSRAARWMVPLIGVALAAAVAIGVLLFAARDDGYAARMDVAAQALQARDWERAISSFEKALATRPGDAAAGAGIAEARKIERASLLESAWRKRDATVLQKALAEAKDLVDADTYGPYASRLATLEDIPRIDDMLKRKRYAKALAAANARLDAGNHPADIKEKLDAQYAAASKALALAQELFTAGKSRAVLKDLDELRTGMESLKRFVDLYPDHADLSEANRLVGQMSATIAILEAEHAKVSEQTRLSIATRPTGIACKSGGRFLGTSPLEVVDKLDPGAHVIELMDDDGLVSRHEVEVVKGTPGRVFLDHAKAVAAEALSYRKVAETRSDPEKIVTFARMYLDAHPEGSKKGEVSALLADAYAALAPPAKLTAGLGVELVLVHGGTFTMGSDDGPDEVKPAHGVSLPGFYIGRFEVTDAQFDAYQRARSGASARAGDAGRRPVVGVSWNEAMDFCRHLSALDPKGAVYRLPTEAEWEYAARGAAGRPYPWGDVAPRAEHANLGGDADGYENLAPVASFAGGATPEGVMDLIGNAAEWCVDWYGPYGGEAQTSPAGPAKGEKKVVRGSAYAYEAKVWSTPVLRAVAPPDSKRDTIGFRVVRELTKQESEAERAARDAR